MDGRVSIVLEDTSCQRRQIGVIHHKAVGLQDVLYIFLELPEYNCNYSVVVAYCGSISHTTLFRLISRFIFCEFQRVIVIQVDMDGKVRCSVHCTEYRVRITNVDDANVGSIFSKCPNMLMDDSFFQCLKFWTWTILHQQSVAKQ